MNHRGRGEVIKGKSTEHSRTVWQAIIKTFAGCSQQTCRQIHAYTVQELGLSVSTIRKHLGVLVKNGELTAVKTGNRVCYKLSPQVSRSFAYAPQKALLDEFAVWLQDLAPLINLPAHAQGIVETAFAEIFNNALSHSAAETIRLHLEINALYTVLTIQDDGVGIFRKIKGDFGLANEHQAVLELSKGKLTSDPAAHSGEGIFFVSKACDKFAIFSGELVFSPSMADPVDLLLWVEPGVISRRGRGTVVCMLISHDTPRTMKEVYDCYCSPDAGFCKTLIPVRMLRCRDEGLVSRSQGKRLVARLENFREIVLDFAGIDWIGQAFADEIFRVYAQARPEVKITAVNTSEDVANMIRRVQAKRIPKAQEHKAAPPGTFTS